ncbi:uncharacterized protein Tco025E_05870 [Trypanosoma conorhini]|uniref:Uncharacterized protein n=1 Tax=Trypanosoma conorhini TaxID=83891 RepID=A0A3R7N1U5_9TRYP|nr:uncharacterized protein Tco025E_05870 [Trypanosoma conorhini]RNF14613.1 hypothetical protein Tco025E_05870 [Trypanosoma conorhini]
MFDTGLMVGVICGSLGGFAVFVWGGIFLCYRLKLFSPAFGVDGEGVRGIPLRSLAPRMTEERRRNLLRARRKMQRDARRQQRRQEREADGVPGDDAERDGGGSGSGSDGTTPSERTHGRNSRWFRRRSSADSLTSATLASSSAVYGHGDYLSRSCTTSPRSQREAASSCRSEEAFPRRRRKSHKRRPRRGSDVVDDGNARNSPFGGWTDSARSCCSSSADSNKVGEEDRRPVEVGIVSPEPERLRPTRRQIIEQNAAMSGFFTVPTHGWSPGQHAENRSCPDRVNL